MDKITNLKDLQYYNNTILLSELINKWVKDKPLNKDLKEFQKGFIGMIFYTNNLQTNLANCKIANSDYREQKNEALLKLQDLKEDIEEYKL
jgi:hypothetical protein|tara:strand:+ start:54 stop:326 length:273 start_codon:yes stop_codon:yes gene_type:complete